MRSLVLRGAIEDATPQDKPKVRPNLTRTLKREAYQLSSGGTGGGLPWLRPKLVSMSIHTCANHSEFWLANVLCHSENRTASLHCWLWCVELRRSRI